MRLTGIRYDSARRFTFKQRVLLCIAPPIMALFIRIFFAVCRVEVRDEENLRGTVERYGHVLLHIWHEDICVGPCHHRGTNAHTLVSHSFDGEMAARVLAWLGIRSVRGSSSQGGAEGLADLARAVEHIEIVGWTLDGPKGPRRVAKPGIARLAARTGIPVVPLAYEADRAWRMSSWDRLQIPKPGARILCAFGQPIPPPADESPEAVEATRLAVETGLNRLHAQLEAELQRDA